jgi:thiol-disulfide isomerase/thioredoxin
MNCNSFGCYPVELQPGYATRPELAKPPPATDASSPRALKLARALKREKVTMFGAYWCGFCDRERQALGTEAWALVDYVECDAMGFGADPQRCYDAGVTAYPTWVKEAPASGGGKSGGSRAPAADTAVAAPDASQRRAGAQGLAGLEKFAGLPSPPPLPAAPPRVASASSLDALRVGAALQAQKAVLFGAYWCGYCNQDRQALGAEAAAMVEYVECDPKGVGADPKRCADAGVDAYPTWEVNGQRSSGAKGLRGLAQLTGVQLAVPMQQAVSNR